MSIDLSTIHPATRPIDAMKIRGITVADTIPASGQVLVYNNGSNRYEPVTIGKNISSVVTDGTTITGDGTLESPLVSHSTGVSSTPFEASSLVYGTNATGCFWTSNLLVVNHALNTTTPDVSVWVLNSVSGKYEVAEIPCAVTDADYVQMDFSGCSGLTFNLKIK